MSRVRSFDFCTRGENFFSSSNVCRQIATNYRKADISERQKAIISFALKVSQNAQEITNEDFEELEKKYKISKEGIWDIGSIEWQI